MKSLERLRVEWAEMQARKKAREERKAARLRVEWAEMQARKKAREERKAARAARGKPPELVPDYRPYREINKQIAEYVAAHPELTYLEIGRQFDRSPYAVGAVAKRAGIKRGRGRVLLAGLAPVRRITPKRYVAMKRENRIIAYVQRHPDMTYREVGQAFGMQASDIGNLMYKRGVKRTHVGEEALALKKQLSDYVIAHPDESYSDIGRKFDQKPHWVSRIARESGIVRGKGQGPRHNQRARGRIVTVQERERARETMLAIWESASDRHRKRMGKIMAGGWTDEARAQFSRALKCMWREALG
jgi:hypothetical protein